MAHTPVTAESDTRPVTRTKGYDRKLEHVVAAAARLISRQGYGQSTLRQVSREAGMSLAGLYHYFSSKEELLFRIQYHTFDAILQGLVKRLEGVDDPKDGLRVIVTNHLEHFLAHMDELKVCAGEMETLTGDYYEQVRVLRQRYLGVTVDMVESIAAEAGGTRADPRLATLYLFGMLNWIYMWYPAAEGTTADTLANQVLILFLDGFLPRDG